MYLVQVSVLLCPVREGKRSEHTPWTLAVVAELNAQVAASPLGSINRLANAVDPKIKRSQLYLLLGGPSVIDLVDLEVICDALGITAADVFAGAAERLRSAGSADPGANVG